MLDETFLDFLSRQFTANRLARQNCRLDTVSHSRRVNRVREPPEPIVQCQPVEEKTRCFTTPYQVSESPFRVIDVLGNQRTMDRSMSKSSLF